MKILSIKLKNINSLRGEFELDFTKEPLKNPGLFAMIGKMGSGKSTILDGITLALYNAIPRYSKISKDAIEKGGLILTKNERDCYAEVRYSCKTGVFRSKWSISKTRNDTFRDYDMELFDENNKLLAGKKTEVPQFNEKLIGLDYDQFSKAILLSQGEFAKFLKSTKNERAQLLEEITATKDFRRLGRLAYFVFGRKKKEIDGQLELIKNLAASLISDQDLAALDDTIKSTAALLAGWTKKLELVKLKIETKNKLILLGKEIGQKREKFEVIKQSIGEFDLKHAEALAQYEQLIPYKEEINEHGIKHQELLKLQISVSENTRKMQGLTERMNGMVGELSAWVKKEVTEDKFFDALDLFKDVVLERINRNKQLIERSLTSSRRIYTSLQQSFFSRERILFNKTGENADLISRLSKRLKEQEQNFLLHLETHSLKENQIALEKARLQDAIRDFELLQADVRSYLQSNRRIKENMVALDELDRVLLENSKNAVELQSKQKELENSFELAERDKQRMLTEKTLDIYRVQLKEGEPCPLCGAESHPYVHEYSKDLGIVEDQYDKIRVLLKTKRQELSEAIIAKSSKEIEIQSIQKVLHRDQSDLQLVKERIDIIKKKQGIDSIGSEDIVREYIAKYKLKLGEIENCLEHLASRPLIEQLLGDLEELENSSKEVTNLQKEISKMYSGSDIQSDVQQRRNSMQSAMKEKTIVQLGISSSESSIKALETRISSIVDTILANIKLLGYTSIAGASEKIISETLFNALTGERNSLKASLQSAENVLMEDEKRFNGESANDDKSVLLDSLITNQQEVVQNINDLTKALEDHRLIWRMQEETRENINKIEGEIKNKKLANYPWELLSKLIGDQTGNKFNNFAQELTLKHLLNFANRRLVKLHSRYILSMPQSGEDDDLAIVDTHMGNERRSVKTLSGGETFIISLALALGLSDLAASDVKIESLFIDEGFGSLDPEVLETTISTLEQLQAESNKTVGIISHVDSLKERIFPQIQLEKQTNGFSTMKIYSGF